MKFSKQELELMYDALENLSAECSDFQITQLMATVSEEIERLERLEDE